MTGCTTCSALLPVPLEYLLQSFYRPITTLYSEPGSSRPQHRCSLPLPLKEAYP